MPEICVNNAWQNCGVLWAVGRAKKYFPIKNKRRHSLYSVFPKGLQAGFATGKYSSQLVCIKIGIRIDYQEERKNERKKM